jgi:branched-subunit amino acid transport protein
MSVLVALATTATLAFICRFMGFALRIPHTSRSWERFTRFIPLSIFSALVASSLYRQADMLSLKIVALLVAGGLAHRTRRFGLSIVAGLAVLWLFTAIGIR